MHREEWGSKVIEHWDPLAQSRIPTLNSVGNSGAAHLEPNAQLLKYKTISSTNYVQAREKNLPQCTSMSFDWTNSLWVELTELKTHLTGRNVFYAKSHWQGAGRANSSFLWIEGNYWLLNHALRTAPKDKHDDPHFFWMNKRVTGAAAICQRQCTSGLKKLGLEYSVLEYTMS